MTTTHFQGIRLHFLENFTRSKCQSSAKKHLAAGRFFHAILFVQIIFLSFSRLLDNSFYTAQDRALIGRKNKKLVASLVANGSIALKFREMVGKVSISDLKSVLIILISYNFLI